MKLIIHFCFFLVCFFYNSNIVSQNIQAPKLSCVQRTGSGASYNFINWHKTSELCGPFLEYQIFVSNNLNGPYTLLTTKNHIDSLSHIHSAITISQVYFYFIKATYSCPGISLHSDTLSDAKIPTPILKAISIENGFPMYQWIPLTNTTKVWGYPVYIIGNLILDTVIGRMSSSFIDSTFNVNSGPYNGSVAAMDSCGGINGISNVNPLYQYTSFLSLTNQTCANEIKFSWTKYRGWTVNDDVKSYQVLVKKNNGLEKVVGTNSSSSLNFSFKDYEYGDSLCIRIRAIHPVDTTIFSHSNQYCFVSTKAQTPELLQLVSASYLSKNIVKVRWYCQPSSKPKSFDLLKFKAKNNNLISNLEKVKYLNESNGFYSFIDSNVFDKFQIKYIPVFEDSCNSKSKGLAGNTIYLDLTQSGLYSNELKWSSNLFSDSLNSRIHHFNIYYSSDGQIFSKLGTVPDTEKLFEHLVESEYLTPGIFCYKLEAVYQFDSSTYFKDSIFSIYSPEQCIQMRTVIWIPNAFKVDGITPNFKPKLYFFNSQIFKMEIINRWGQKVFETSDHLSGWSGIMNNGTMAPEGAYVYKISYMGNEGLEISKTGTVNLIR